MASCLCFAVLSPNIFNGKNVGPFLEMQNWIGSQ